MTHWLVDTDIFIEAERGNSAFGQWLSQVDSVATADIVRGEFLLGVHAVSDAARRQRGIQFYTDRIANLPSLQSEPTMPKRRALRERRAVSAKPNQG